MTRSFSVYCLLTCLALSMPNAWAQSKTKPATKSQNKTAGPFGPAKKAATGAALIDALEKNEVAKALELVKRGADPNATNDDKTFTALGLAAAAGNRQLVEALVERGAKVNVDPSMNAPLNLASGDDAVAIMTYLVEKGADVNSNGGSMELYRPLVNAAALGSIPLVTLLLDKGAQINHVEEEGITPLAGAAESGNVALVELMVARGAQLNNDEFVVQRAVASGSIAAVDFLAQHGRPLTTEKQPDTYSLLHLALVSDKPAMIERVLQDTKTGIEDRVEEEGYTPLMIAASLHKPNAVQFLIERKANVNAITQDYLSVLEIAEDVRLDEEVDAPDTKKTIALLRSAGAKPTPPSLFRAVVQGDKKQLTALLAKGVDTNEPDAFQAVPLYYAIQRRSRADVDMAASLLAKGANPNAKAPDGRSLLDVARDEENSEAIALLRQAGTEAPEIEITEAIERGDMNRVSALLEKGIVPEPGALVYAMGMDDNLALFQKLLDKGAKINAPSRLQLRFLFFDAGFDFPLHAAVGMGNVAATKILLERGADPNIHKKGEATPLLSVSATKGKGNRSENSRPEIDTDTIDIIVRLLIEHGANVLAISDQERKGESPLKSLAGKASAKTVEYLLDKGAIAEINEDRDGLGATPLSAAVGNGDPAVVRLLLNRGANPNPSPKGMSDDAVLLRIAQGKDSPEAHEITRLLIQHGAELDVKNQLGENPLQLAQEAGNIGIVKILREAGSKKATIAPEAAMRQAIDRYDDETVVQLLKNGYDPNMPLMGGELPIYEAAFMENLPVVKLFLDRGANIDKKGMLGTALHAAAATEEPEIVRFLLARGATVDADDGFQGTPLARAAEHGSVAIMRILLKAGADPSAKKSEHPNAPLTLAVRKGESEAIDLLLKSGANTNVPDLLSATLWLGNIHLMERLVRMGTDVNLQNEMGRTVLMDAALLGNKDYVTWLIAHKAKVNLKDKQGKTALSEAMDRDKTVCAQILRKAGAQ